MFSFNSANAFVGSFQVEYLRELKQIVQVWVYRSWVTIYLYLRNSYSTESDVYNAIAFLRDFIFIWVFAKYFQKCFRIVRGYGIIGVIKKVYYSVARATFSFILSVPPIKKKVQKQLQSTIQKIEDTLMKNDTGLLQFKELPEKGLSKTKVLEELDRLQDLEHSEWSRGRVSGAVYHGGMDLLDLQAQTYGKYSIANQLHPDVFPAVRKMEAELVSMVLKLFNAPESGCGCTSSGGTESLLLAGLAAREYGRRYKGITEPEIIAPVTIHAGIEKACYYFGIKLHKVELDPITFQVDTKKVRKLINGNTVMLTGSAPNYPHGIIDDIEQLSDLAVKFGIPLHVDACLGSFIVTFLEKSKVHKDLPIPRFDFRLKGVTSISCDTHKYAFAPKGSSIIMYRDPKLRACQYYVLTNWTGGMYGSPTLAGSRPGALMVGCWSTLVYFGQEGYSKSCYEIVSAAMKLKHSIQENPILKKYLEVLGDPISSVVAFKLKKDYESRFSIFEVGDLLTEKGWYFSTLQNPGALHFAFTRLTVNVVDEIISDIVACVEKASQSGTKKTSETAALYGVAGSVNTAGIAEKLVEAFLDTLYKI